MIEPIKPKSDDTRKTGRLPYFLEKAEAKGSLAPATKSW
jgi:hypothetical protein